MEQSYGFGLTQAAAVALEFPLESAGGTTNTAVTAAVLLSLPMRFRSNRASVAAFRLGYRARNG